MTESDKQEIALALLIWKFARHGVHMTGEAGGLILTAEGAATAEAALRLAKLAGVKDEFLQLTFDFPVLRIKIEELDPWISKNTFASPKDLCGKGLTPKKHSAGRKKAKRRPKYG